MKIYTCFWSTNKHELTLSFDSSDELWEFAKKHQDKIVSVSDYEIYKIQEDCIESYEGSDKE